MDGRARFSLADRLTDDAAHWLPRPRHTHIRKVALPNCPTEGVRAEHSGTARAILYLHGGVFLTSGLNTYRALVLCLSRSADAPVLNVGYRMQPRYPIGSAVPMRWTTIAGCPRRATVTATSWWPLIPPVAALLS